VFVISLLYGFGDLERNLDWVDPAELIILLLFDDF
jgi:hypothetical protein